MTDVAMTGTETKIMDKLRQQDIGKDQDLYMKMKDLESQLEMLQI